MTNPYSLVFADDHPLVLAGMRDFFAHDLSLKVVAMVSSPTELVDSIITHKPDIAVTDFSMPGDQRYGDGLHFISYLTRHFPDTRVLIVTMISNPLIIKSLYKAGVAGVVLKSDDMSQLRQALHAIRLGRTYTHPSMAIDHTQASATTTTNLTAVLSPKELEVLRHFTEGKSLTAIAQEMNRSIKTISNQKQSAMRKLGISSDQELISYCVMGKLFE